MNLKKAAAAVLFFSCFLTGAQAQVIDTISYVPVKHGYYDQIVTKSTSKLATTTGIATMESLQVNSGKLEIEAARVNFGKPVYVVQNVVATEGALIGGANAKVGGQLTTGGILKTKKITLGGSKKVKAKDISIPNKKIIMPAAASSLEIDGVQLLMPSCPVDGGGKRGAEWIEATGWDRNGSYTTFQVYGCTGTMGAPKCLASQRDKNACNNSKNNWDDVNCCCNGNFITNFPDNSGMCGNTNAMCQGTKLVNQYVACSQYGSSSAQCICAKGDRTTCLAAIYGSNADELKCTSGNETTWPCSCADYKKLNSYGFVNYACLFPGKAQRCPLECEFPMVKELTYSGKYECVCMDQYLFGPYNNNNNGYFPQCKTTYPVSSKFQGCCCGTYNDPYDYSNMKYFTAANPNIYGYAYNYYYAAQHDQTLPNPSCPSGYYNVPSNYGGTEQKYISGAYPCSCSGMNW